MMTQDLNKQFNIPAWVKGNTIADESASIMKRFEGRNDNASIATKEALLKSIMKKQEFLKMQEAMKTQSQQVPDSMNGQVPEGMEQFMEPQEGQMAYGGVKQYWEGGAVTPIKTNLMGVDEIPGAGIDPTMVGGAGANGGPLGVATGGAGIGDIGGAAQSLLTAGQDIFGKPDVNVKGTQNYDINQFKKDKLAKGIGGGVDVIKGIATGNPMDIIKGGSAVLGSIFGKGKDEMETANQRFVGSQNAALRQSDFAFGGFRNGKGNYNYSDLSKPLEIIDEKLINPSMSFPTPTTMGTYAKRTDPNFNFKSTLGPTPYFEKGNTALAEQEAQDRLDADSAFLREDKFTQKAVRKQPIDTGIGHIDGEQNFIDKPINWLNENAANIGQFSPVLGNLLELKNLKKSPTQRGTRLDSVYKEYNPDEARQLNVLNQQNTERALTETSTGNLGGLRNQLQAAGLNKLKGQSEVLSNIDLVKAGEAGKAQQFKQQGDTVNAELDRDFLDRSARDKAAFETTKSNLKSALFEDVGKISKEHLDKKTVQKMFGYKWNGEYYIDKDGKQISTSDVWKQVQGLIGGDKSKKTK